jgi:predicted hotdog family 3-hydroxylacyl-ACP dehydratase
MAINHLPLKDIRHLIPQKKPFVMVDTLLQFSSDKINSSFQIPEDNLFVEDNYFCESGLVENMAQTVALHTGYDFFIKGKQAPTGYIGSIKKISINRLPRLNETIFTKATILHEFMGITMVTVTVSDASNIEIASGEMKTVIVS